MRDDDDTDDFGDKEFRANMSRHEIDFFEEVGSLKDFQRLEAEMARRRENLPPLAMKRLDSLAGDPDAIEVLLDLHGFHFPESMKGLDEPF